MSEHSRQPSDEAVRRALLDVAAATAPAPDLAARLIVNAQAGEPRVVRLGARRARWAAPLLAAAVTAALALGGVAITTTLADDRTPTTTQAPTVDPTDPGVPTNTPTPTPSSTGPHPSHSTPRPSPPASVRRSSAVSRPDLTTAALANATIDLPAWPGVGGGDRCLSGEHRFRDGRNALPATSATPADQNYMMFEGQEAVGDVDGDGADDVTAILFCGVYQPVGYRVLSFRATVSGVEVIGEVSPPTPADDGVQRAGSPTGVRTGPQNSVVVHWERGAGKEAHDRTYRRVGGSFRQVAGPTLFPPRHSDLSVASDGGVLHRYVTLSRGKIVLIVRNAGPRAVTGIDLYVRHRGAQVYQVQSASRRYSTHYLSPGTQLVSLPGLGVGRSLRLRVIVSAQKSSTEAHLTFDVGVYGDPKPGNDKVSPPLVIR